MRLALGDDALVRLKKKPTEQLTEIAISKGAVVRCKEGHSAYFRACDDEAERETFRAIAEAYERGELVGSSLLAVMADMTSVLDSLDDRCVLCERLAHP